MKNKLLKTFALFGAACLLASCGQQPSAPAEDAAQEPETQATAEPEAAPEPTEEPGPAYSWAVEPTVEADDIEPPTLFRGGDDWLDFNAYDMETDDGLFHIQQGEKLGLIDLEGTLIVPCEYEAIDVGYGGRYMIFPDAYSGGKTLDGSLTLKDATDEELLEISGTAPNTELFWLPELDEAHVGGGGDTAIMELYDRTEPTVALCVTATESYPSSYYEGDTLVEGEQLYAAEFGDYVLVSGGKAVTDEAFEEHGSFSCGIIPLCRDGKWGYLDAEGSEVFPFEYDGTWDKGTGRLYSYDATYGTVVLYKDGACALYAADGTEIIPFGAFEALRPVYGDRLWAKQDGKWGVLQLSQQWATTQRERG